MVVRVYDSGFMSHQSPMLKVNRKKNRSIKVFIKKHKESLQGSTVLYIRYLIDLGLTSPPSHHHIPQMNTMNLSLKILVEMIL